MYDTMVRNGTHKNPQFMPSRPSPLSSSDNLRESRLMGFQLRSGTGASRLTNNFTHSNNYSQTGKAQYNDSDEDDNDGESVQSFTDFEDDEKLQQDKSITKSANRSEDVSPTNDTFNSSSFNMVISKSHISDESNSNLSTLNSIATAGFRGDQVPAENRINDNEFKQSDYNEIRKELRRARKRSIDSSTIEKGPSEHYKKSVPPEFLNRLRSFSLFKDAPKSFHTRIASRLRLIQYQPQATIINKGDSSKSMYWILKGSVAVTSEDVETIYAELIPGCFFGEIGILFNRPRTATVVARTKVLLGVLTADTLNMILPEYPFIERRIRDEAQERLAILDKKNKAAKLSNFTSSTNGNGNNTEGLSLSTTVSRRSSIIPTNSNSNSQINLNDINALDNQRHLSTTFLNPAIPSPTIPPILVDRVGSPSLDDTSLPTDSVDLTISIQQFIKNMPIFQNLPAKFIHKLALGVEPLQFQPYEFIFKKGDYGADIYFIVGGEVEVFDNVESNLNYEECLARLGYGSYFGEMSFLSFLNHSHIHAKRSANVRTVSSCDLIVIRHDNLEELCRTYPFILDDMRKTAHQRNVFNNTQKKNKGRIPIDYLINDLPNSKISPISSPPPGTHSFQNYSLLQASNRKRTNQSEDEGSPMHINDGYKHSKDLLPQSLLTMSLPPLNPSLPPINSFFKAQYMSKESDFQYYPHLKRMRLASIGGSRGGKLSRLRNSTIPDSLLLKVFEYLTLPELMKLRLVNKKWRQLLYFAPNLLNTLDLKPWNTTIDDKSLIEITNFVGSRPKIIDISNCFHITDEGFTYMINEIGISGQIKILRMGSIWEVSAMAIMDISVPSVGKHLEELQLSNCRNIRDNVLERIFGFDESMVTESSQYDNTLGFGCRKLKKVNVGYCKHLTDNFMKHISLHANNTLETLDLTRCTTITDKGFQYWVTRSFPNLKNLNLKDCTFLTDASIAYIARSAKNLVSLNLNFCCALSDNAIETLCRECHYLKFLDLSFCGSAVSDSSLVQISLHLKHLEKLIVTGCIRVTRAGIDSVLSGCTELYYLNISQCKNAHIYPGRIPAQKLNVNAQTKSAFVTAGAYQNVIEIVL